MTLPTPAPPRGVTKTGLLAALVAQVTEDYRRRMWPALTAYGSGGDRLAQALEALCEATEANLALVVGLNAQSDGVFHADEGADEPAMTRSVFTEPLERLRRDGMADGTVRSGDAEGNATLLCNLVGWTNVHLRTGHRWDPARARRATLDPVVHGLLL